MESRGYQGGDPVAEREGPDLLAAADRATRRGADGGVLMLQEVRSGARERGSPTRYRRPERRSPPRGRS